MAQSGDLQGQVALVTGGSGGIGDAVLGELLRRGAHAVSLDRVPSSRHDVPWRQTDLRSATSVQSVVQELFEQHGRIDIAVHAAGVSRDAVVWKLTPEDWDAVHAVNLRGAFLLLHHVVPCMRQGQGGRIVLIGSINGSRGKFGLAAYASSKAGLLGLCRSVARETARFGVLVNVVEPGMVRTPMIDALPESVRQAAIEETLLGRLAEAEDIAHAVSFLCGPESRHITGQTLRVDGGQYL